MRPNAASILVLLSAIGISTAASADFVITSAVLEFTHDKPKLQDIELVSRSKEGDYVVSEISEIQNPGMADEKRDPADVDHSRILVTPEKTILPAGARKVLRFVLLKEPDDKEHIYRVAVKPVINGVNNQSKIGLKVLVGYEALVIIRPQSMAPKYEASRQGKTLTITNTGNTNILFQNGMQCIAEQSCPLPPAIRVYAGQKAEVALPQDKPVTYSVWDGITTADRQFE